MSCGGGSGSDCQVGSLDCMCMPGQGCDPGLTCVGGFCRDDDGGTTGGGTASATASETQSPTSDPTSADSDPSATDSGVDTTTGSESGEDTMELKLDVGSASDLPIGRCTETGCKAVDMLFALDSSLSMSEEIQALAASQAFSAIIEDLEGLNCGNIEYRIGLTNDNDGGFIGWNGKPWFDSTEMTAQEIAAAFSAAANTVLGNGGTAIGCEHVLSSAADLLASDNTGFLRDDALLVLVLVTDVDDYGYYDQLGWEGCTGGLCPCNLLCATSGQPVQTIHDNLVALKGGDAAGVSAIVIAGDPSVPAGANFCGQPASCCGNGLECGQAHHAPRLWEFADLQTGSNGYTANICAGAQQVPAAIQDALENNIDLACQAFEPEG